MEIVLDMRVLGNMHLPEDAMLWLMHKPLELPTRPNWLDTSVAAFRDAPMSHIDSVKRQLRIAQKPKMSMSALLICEHDFNTFALGHAMDAEHPVLPSVAGNLLQSRFAVQFDPIARVWRTIISTTYDSGHVAVSVHWTRDDFKTEAKTFLIHKDKPSEIIFNLRSIEDPNSGNLRGLEWPVASEESTSFPLIPYETPGISAWERFRSFFLNYTRGWRELRMQTRGVLNSKVKVPVFCRFTEAGDAVLAMRRVYVQKLVENVLEKPLFVKTSAPDNFSMVSSCPSTQVLAITDGTSSEGKEKKVTDASPDIFKCQKCSASFKRRYEYKRHNDTVHDGLRKFDCPICHKLFTQVAHVRVHIDTVHKKTRSCLCDICGHAFGTKHKLVRHKKSVHEKMRPHSCVQCGTSYFQQSDLRRHQKIKHGLKEEVPAT